MAPPPQQQSREHCGQNKANQCSHTPKKIQMELNSQTSSKMKKHQIGAQMELNKQICVAADRSVEAVLQLAQAKHGMMSLVNISTVFHRLARIAQADDNEECAPSAVGADSRFQALLTKVKEQLKLDNKGEERARCISTIAWSCAKIRVYDAHLMDIISKRAEGCLELFKPFELANLLWAFLKMQLTTRSSALFKMAHGHIRLHIEEYPLASLTMVAWIFANAHILGIIPHQMCAQIIRKAAELFAHRVQDMPAWEKRPNPVAIENLTWSLATMHMHTCAGVLDVIGEAALQVLHDFKAYELSITLWAFARLGARHDRLFCAAEELMRKSSALRNNLHAQGVANMIWAFAKQTAAFPRGESNSFSGTLRALLPRCQQLLPRMKPLEFSSLLWAASKLGQQWGRDTAADELFESTVCAIVCQHDDNLLENWSRQSIGNVLRVCHSYLGQMMSVAPFEDFIAKLLDLCARPQSECDIDSSLDQSRAESASSQDVAEQTCNEDCNEDEDAFKAFSKEEFHYLQSVMRREQPPMPKFCSKDVPAQMPQELEIQSITLEDLSSAYDACKFDFEAMTPAYVEPPRTKQNNAASVDIIDELTFKKGNLLMLTFEVNSSESYKTYKVLVEVFANGGCDHSFELVMDAGYDIPNTRTLQLPMKEPMELHFTLMRSSGVIVGEKAVHRFDQVDKNLNFCEDTVSTCAGSDHDYQL